MNLPVDLQDFICSGFAPDDCQAASALLASASIEDGTFASDRFEVRGLTQPMRR